MNSLTCHVASNTMTRKSQKKRQNKSAAKMVMQSQYNITSVPRAIGAQVRSHENRVVLTNTEIVATLTNLLAYNYVINPFSPVAKPWLSGLAASYGRFRFRKLAFKYNPLTSTSGDGSIVMAFGFDMADVFPQNTGGYTTSTQSLSVTAKDNLVSYHPSYTGPVWMPAQLEVPVARLQENRVTTSVAGSTTDDWSQGLVTSTAATARNWFSDGYCVLAGNTSGNAPIGQLLCEYEIELYDPILATDNS